MRELVLVDVKVVWKWLIQVWILSGRSLLQAHPTTSRRRSSEYTCQKSLIALSKAASIICEGCMAHLKHRRRRAKPQLHTKRRKETRGRRDGEGKNPMGWFYRHRLHESHCVIVSHMTYFSLPGVEQGWGKSSALCPETPLARTGC